MLPVDVTEHAGSPVPASRKQHEVTLARQLQEDVAVGIVEVKQVHSLDGRPRRGTVGDDQFGRCVGYDDPGIFHRRFIVLGRFDELPDFVWDRPGPGPRPVDVLGLVPRVAANIEIQVLAAASEAEVTATTIDRTDVVEVVKRTEDTDIPVVPFWKVEVKPKPINIPVPTYPDMARTAGIEGQAVVEALVDVDGSVADARILKPSGNASLDQAAVDAALRSKFTPAYQRDKPVRVWVSIPFRFTLMN